MTTLKGVGVSDGIAFGKAYCLAKPDLTFDKDTFLGIEQEEARLKKAFRDTKTTIMNIRQHNSAEMAKKYLDILDFYLEVLSDPELINEVKRVITEENKNAAVALNRVFNQYAAIFLKMNDEYLRERVHDINDMRDQLLGRLLDIDTPDLSLIDQPVVIVANSISPTQIAQVQKENILGIVTAVGTKTSRAAIISRSMDVPAVLGLQTSLSNIKNGEQLIVDGSSGEVVTAPDHHEIEKYQRKSEKFKQQRKVWAKFINQPTKTLDGQNLLLGANVSSENEVENALNVGADSMGLFRTEYIYMNSDHLPSEDEQTSIYQNIVSKVNGKQLTFRTMDIGGDKLVSYLPNIAHKESNPFLGYRAIRYSLGESSIFRTQIRALLRSSAYGPIRIMFPMISTISELDQALSIYNEERQNLINEGVPVGSVQLGTMIEVPAAAIMIDKIISKVDFVSIGTNDLVQYTVAVDRGNERVSYLYQACDPAVLRLIGHVVRMVHKAGKIVGICGEVAADPQVIPFLIGLGMDELSTTPTQILKTRAYISRINSQTAGQLADNIILNAGTTSEVNNMIQDFTSRMPE
ncbi:phosphoenolpyruvate--protein phosphotransferase [Fructilactobacillus fructivorans]|uniref:phosphoenolpyruvate--protein phosphotransferase n=1 Tax=Fructilactobacillus fructivorans TaxID=1614 RepID=UPI000704A804|nr:phosphoenolpyruvate--protein phosphotransferase [Fructilactobacillus fructivorans]KRN12246.1 phosphoenolpyruvate--protein phosphotransferase [Fructilactobacillus fructivorans]